MAENVKRYMIRFTASMVAYVLILISSVAWLGSNDTGPLVRGAVALMPVIPGLFALWAVVVFYRSIDEFKQRLVAEAMIIAALLMGFGTFAYGFLEGALALPAFPTIWIFPTLIGLWGLVGCFQKYVVYR